MNASMVVAGAAAVVVLWGIMTYNGLVRRRNQKDEGWSGIDVQLKRRSDLVPNLVETVKGFAAHESGTLERVIQARNAAVTASSPEDRISAENALTGSLRQLFALSESYPELKANENFLHLQDELSGLENELQMARRYYNGTAREHNNACQMFPGVIIANMFGFKTAPYFEAEEEARATPKVQF